jgi:hypothetical protein
MDNCITEPEVPVKLFCTFSNKENLDTTTTSLSSQYFVLFGKIFVFSLVDYNEYVCTYNLDTEMLQPGLLDNTILIHRKKETNSLYTINALNHLISELNNGKLDPSFKVNWEDYRNTLIITQDSNLKFLKLKIHNIISL